MTALAAVATHVPDGRVPIEDLADQLGLSPMQMKIFRRYHKLNEVSRDPDPSGTLLDLLRAAVADLEELRGHEHQVRYVLHARSFPVIAPHPLNPLHELCRELGLDNASAFAVGHHACASGLLAIDVAGRLLAADGDPDGLALVLAGEKAFTDEARMVMETSFFGEGASACLVRASGDRDRLLSYVADLHGEFDGDSEDLAKDYQEQYTDLLAGAVLAAVGRSGLRMDEISLILPHNVNRMAWQRACRRLEFPIAQVVLDQVPVYGHVFCADAFINYQTAQAQGLLKPGERYVLAAAGAGRGAVFSAMVFEH
jgi:3-oxoacyl-[acyl-carrier-protein] synthase III